MTIDDRKGKPKRGNPKGLLWMVGAGAVAGLLFNLAFGTAAWNPEGISGGILSGVLIHLLS